MNNAKTAILLPVFHVCNVLLLTGLTVYAIITWGELPAKVPVHFGFGGVPDRWAVKGFEIIFIYLMPWIITVLLYAVTYFLVPWMVKKHPGSVNIPNKEKFLALPAEQQRPVWICMNELMAAMCVMVNIIFCYLLHGTIAVATGRADKLDSALLFLLLGLLVAVLVFYTIRLLRITRRVTSQ